MLDGHRIGRDWALRAARSRLVSPRLISDQNWAGYRRSHSRSLPPLSGRPRALGEGLERVSSRPVVVCQATNARDETDGCAFARKSLPARPRPHRARFRFGRQPTIPARAAGVLLLQAFRRPAAQNQMRERTIRDAAARFVGSRPTAAPTERRRDSERRAACDNSGQRLRGPSNRHRRTLRSTSFSSSSGWNPSSPTARSCP
jgi:hypothetical protein